MGWGGGRGEKETESFWGQLSQSQEMDNFPAPGMSQRVFYNAGATVLNKILLLDTGSIS